MRKIINSRMQGNFHSVFKGSGLEFTDVRDYQYGDDVRAIDWNVSAKGHGTFVKNFHEEKEQHVIILIDVSASQDIGKVKRKKIDLAKEIGGVLTLSALKEGSYVGLFCFSDKKELYVFPDKGIKHGYNCISKLYELLPTSLKTGLNKAFTLLLSVLKRKSAVIIISDFIDEGYEKSLKALSVRHDVSVIHLSDLREINFPGLGIIPLFDKETKKTVWVNSSSKVFKSEIDGMFNSNRKEVEKLCKNFKINYQWIDTKEEYMPKLIKLFETGNRNKYAKK